MGWWQAGSPGAATSEHFVQQELLLLVRMRHPPERKPSRRFGHYLGLVGHHAVAEQREAAVIQRFTAVVAPSRGEERADVKAQRRLLRLVALLLVLGLGVVVVVVVVVVGLVGGSAGGGCRGGRGGGHVEGGVLRRLGRHRGPRQRQPRLLARECGECVESQVLLLRVLLWWELRVLVVLMVVVVAVAVAEVVTVWRVLLVQPRWRLVVHVWRLRLEEVVGLRLVRHGRGQQWKGRLGHAPRIPPER